MMESQDEKTCQDYHYEIAGLQDTLYVANRRIEDLRDDLIEISALFPDPDLDAIERIVRHALLEV